MTLLEITLLTPLLGGLLLAAIGQRSAAGWINVATCAAT